MQRDDAMGHVAPGDLLEPGLFHQRGEVGLARELADALDQILVGSGLPCRQLAELRDDGEGIAVVERLERRRRQMAELQAEEPAARLQHPPHVAQGGQAVGDIAEAEGNRHGVGHAIGQGQAFGVARDPGHARDALVERAVPADGRHLRVRVDHQRLQPALRPGLRAKRDIARAAGDVDQPLPGARRQIGDQRGLPEAVQAAAHQVVHQVVAVSDRIEDAAHQRRLLGDRHGAEAEVDAVCGWDIGFGHDRPGQ